MSIIGITMGCPSGIGPEIILKYFQDIRHQPEVSPVVIGDMGILQKCAREMNLPESLIPWQIGSPVPEQGIPVLESSQIAIADHVWGSPTMDTARAMGDYIHDAVNLLKDGELAAMVTCPISKKALQQAGYSYPGHTEMLADLTNISRYTMMMAGSSLKVTLVTIHCALAEVPRRLSVDSILERIEITDSALKTDFGLSRPRIAVAGLNPHSGEEGMFGLEEQGHILPAIEKARVAGIDVSGPVPPDTVFFQATSGSYDAVVCMYHDQGLIPFKLLHFKDGVNVTLGLPIVRTSVDHGTAYDIAGKGIADPASLTAAVEMAAEICNNRKNSTQSTASV